MWTVRSKLAAIRVLAVGVAVAAMATLWCMGTGVVEAKSKRNSDDPLRLAQAEALPQLKRATKSAIRALRVAEKAGVKELRALGKALRTGRGLEELLGPGAKTDDGSFPLEKFFEVFVQRVGSTSRDILDILSSAHTEMELERASAAAKHGVSPDELGLVTGDALDRLLAAGARTSGAVDRASKQTTSILQEFHERTFYGLPGGLPPSPSPYSRLPELRFGVVTDFGAVRIVFSPGLASTSQPVDISGLLQAVDGVTEPIEMMATEDPVTGWWWLAAEGVSPGSYTYVVSAVEDGDECCIERGWLFVPEPPPPAPGAPPTETVASLSFEGGTYTNEFVLDGGTIDEFNRIIIAESTGYVVYIECNWQGGDAFNSACGLMLEFGANGKAFTSGVPFSLEGDDDDNTSFSFGRLENMMFVDRGSPLSAAPNLVGTVTLHADGSNGFRVAIDVTGPTVERTGNPATEIATVSIQGTIASPVPSTSE